LVNGFVPIDTVRRNSVVDVKMAKKLIFTLLWMGAGFVASGILAAVIGPLLPKTPGVVGDETSSTVKVVYAGFALIPFVVIATCLFLGLFGILPGTKRAVPK
jgi:hypothetical protein